MTPREPIGILGGTFDPVHAGHLAVAEAVERALRLHRILLVPARVPPHRDAPRVSIYHRFAMVALATLTAESLVACDIELDSSQPSYTAVLLDRLREAGHHPSQMVFITGADAFAEIATWHDYPAVLDRAHFAVVSRPGVTAASLRRKLSLPTARFIELGSTPTRGVADRPSIYLIEADTPDVSSTEIRRRLRSGATLRDLLPQPVEDYIRRHDLYADS